MEAEIRVRFLRIVAEASGTPADELEPLPEAAAPPLTFLQHMDRWVEYQASKVSLHLGKLLSKTYTRRLRSLRDELAKFEKARKYPLSFASIDANFYAKYQGYQLKMLGNKVNTFTGYSRTSKTSSTGVRSSAYRLRPSFTISKLRRSISAQRPSRKPSYWPGSRWTSVRWNPLPTSLDTLN